MLKTSLILAASLAVVLAHEDETTGCRAIARLLGPGVEGNITFHQHQNGQVHVSGAIFGLPPGQYGFHVHEKGDLTGGCATAGSHFNPEMKDHGHPGDENRHVGDLGNVAFDQTGYAYLDFLDNKLSLSGPHNIVGRSVVLHERADDFGRTEHPDSRKTGNAGGRVACGVIGILDPVYGWKTSGASVASVFISTIITTTIIAIII